MPNNISEQSICYYLFQEDANKLFSNMKFTSPKERTECIDEYLTIAMKVNLFILEKFDGFYLLDPMSFNNQCHLNALKLAQLRNRVLDGKALKDLDEADARFLHLSFFLSYFFKDQNLFVKVVNKITRELGIKVKSPKKFAAFLRDEGRYREKAARTAFGKLFESSIKNEFQSKKDKNPLVEELAHLSNEALMVESSHGAREGNVFTLPKLAGVAYFVQQVADEKLPIVLKVKVIDENGVLGNVVAASREIDPNESVIIFEGISSRSYSIQFCREEALKCSSYFYQHVDKNRLHKADKPCFFCKSQPIELYSFQDRLNSVLLDYENLLYALGTDFVVEKQPFFKGFFEDKEKYPGLTELFERSLPKISEFGVAMNNPTTFSVCHVHMDKGEQALSPKMILENAPEFNLKERGIL